jgi:hypothetical protein
MRIQGKAIAAVAILIGWLTGPAAAAAQTAPAGPAPAGAAGAGAQSGQQPPLDDHPQATDLAKQTQNPVASLISVPLQGNWDMGVGDRGATGTLLNIQPVIPFALTPSTNVILRVIMPLTSQPTNDGARVSGMSDVVLSTFLSPAKVGKLIWGAGPVFLLPTATNNALGTEKFAVGPTAVALMQPGHWSFGMLYNQYWSVSGATDRADVNQMLLQPFLNYNLGRGLAVGMSSESTANWKADEVWTVPLYFNVSKVALLGKRPVNYQWQVGPNLAAPEGGADWRFRFALVFLFPR